MNWRPDSGDRAKQRETCLIRLGTFEPEHWPEHWPTDGALRQQSAYSKRRPIKYDEAVEPNGFSETILPNWPASDSDSELLDMAALRVFEGVRPFSSEKLSIPAFPFFRLSKR